MIDKAKQRSIITTIKALCEADHLPEPAREERRQLLFIGLMLGLQSELPPHWQMNIQCNRTDRIMDEFEKEPKAILLCPNGACITVYPENGTDFTLAELQAHIGGYVETKVLPQSGRIVAWDEDGLSKKLPVNAEATKRMRGKVNMSAMGIVGNVLICDKGTIR